MFVCILFFSISAGEIFVCVCKIYQRPCKLRIANMRWRSSKDIILCVCVCFCSVVEFCCFHRIATYAIRQFSMQRADDSTQIFDQNNSHGICERHQQFLNCITDARAWVSELQTHLTTIALISHAFQEMKVSLRLRMRKH